MAFATRGYRLWFLLALGACGGADEQGGPEGDADAQEDGAVQSDAGARDAGESLDGSSANDAAAQHDANVGTNDAGSGAGDVQSASAFFFGHSLVGWDMPAMIDSFAEARGQSFDSTGQIGWGTSLKMHVDWSGDRGNAPLGFDSDSFAHAGYEGEGKAELDTGDYDVVVLTESNGHTATNGDETVSAALTLARRARAARSDVRLFLYANWLNRDDFDSLSAWQARTASDLAFWESVADRVNAQLDGEDMMVLPVGQILAEITADIQSGAIGGIGVDDLFREGDGVHVNDRGFYLVALAHYVAIYRSSPVGLPVQVRDENGQADALPSAVATAFQERVWSELRSYARSGVR